MSDPRVSVIIPTYNREKLILKALDSVFNQTFEDYEILIIDDASTDRTEQVIQELNHPKIRYYKLDKNQGQCIARNVGIKKAKGEFIGFLDSDDEWLPEKLQKQVACFDNGPERLGSVYCYSYSKNALRGESVLIEGNYFRGDIHGRFLQGFCPPSPTLFLVKRSAVDSVNGFDEKLVTFVDLDLWIRISESHEFDYVEEPLIIKHEQIGEQYVNNFEKRYHGYFLFLDKWGDAIKDKFQDKGLMKFKRVLVNSIVVPLLDHPPKNLRRNIPKLIGLLIRVRMSYLRFYTKSILILLFGPNIIYRIRKIRG